MYVYFGIIFLFQARTYFTIKYEGRNYQERREIQKYGIIIPTKKFTLHTQEKYGNHKKIAVPTKKKNVSLSEATSCNSDRRTSRNMLRMNQQSRRSNQIKIHQFFMVL